MIDEVFVLKWKKVVKKDKDVKEEDMKFVVDEEDEYLDVIDEVFVLKCKKSVKKEKFVKKEFCEFKKYVFLDIKVVDLDLNEVEIKKF